MVFSFIGRIMIERPAGSTVGHVIHLPQRIPMVSRFQGGSVVAWGRNTGIRLSTRSRRFHQAYKEYSLHLMQHRQCAPILWRHRISLSRKTALWRNIMREILFIKHICNIDMLHLSILQISYSYQAEGPQDSEPREQLHRSVSKLSVSLSLLHLPWLACTKVHKYKHVYSIFEKNLNYFIKCKGIHAADALCKAAATSSLYNYLKYLII